MHDHQTLNSHLKRFAKSSFFHGHLFNKGLSIIVNVKLSAQNTL